MPDVSVLTPSLGYGRFLEDAILSVIGQSRVSVEHVVQDGGSADESSAVLQRYGDAVLWRSEPDAGQSDALNRALRRASGRWVGWLNADEFYMPEALAQLVAAGERTEADVVYADAAFVDERGRLLRLVPQHGFSPLLLRWYGNFLPTCATLIRRTRLAEGSFDPGLRRLMDWDLFLSLARLNARFVHLRRPVGAFRVHDAQVTARPPGDDVAEYRVVERRHHAPPLSIRRVGRVGHGLLKVVEGAYRRERRLGSLRGADLRWFASGSALRAWPELLARYDARGV